MSDINLSLIDGGDINLGITEDGDINLSIEDDSSINLSIEGVTSFVTLTDSPSTYSGQSGKVVSVNSGETGVEFTTATGGEWGTITGTLSNQTDLQSALDLKVEEDTSPNFLEPSLDAIQFDLTATPTCAEGKMHWNVEDGTLEVGMPGGVVKLQVGQETIMRVTNQSGADMSNGDVVYVSGGAGNRPTIELADADSLFTSGVIGVLTENISNNNSGYVTTFGLVRDVNTSGFLAGQVLWLSTTAGELTNVRPSPPKTSVVVAICVVSHATEGVILVKTQNVPRLVGLSDVDISGQSDNDFIYYDDASTTWKSKQLTGGDITGFTEGSVPFADSNGSLTQDNSDFFWDNVNKRLRLGDGTTGSIKIGDGILSKTIGSGWDFQGSIDCDDVIEAVRFKVGETYIPYTDDKNYITGETIFRNTSLTEAMRILSNGNVGIGTDSPDEKLSINGTMELLDSASGKSANVYYSQPVFGRLTYAIEPNSAKSEVKFVSKGAINGLGETYFVIASTEDGNLGNNLLMGVSAGRAFLTNALNYGSAGTLHLGGYSWAEDGVLELSGRTSTATGQAVITGNVGIGTTDPDTKLDVNGAITQRELSSDPADPDEGAFVTWMSDGTGAGDDGDILMKITAGGSTKTITIVDFSAA